MSYRKISAGTKMEAVIRAFRGESVTAVASEIGVTRNSVARWIHKAKEAMRKCLELNGENRNGQKQCLPDESWELQKLKKVVREQRKETKRLRASAGKRSEEPRPGKCPRCECERFYKKGFVKVRLRTLLKTWRNGPHDKVPVQMFVCVNCGYATHLEGPGALYHWVVGQVKE